MLKFLVVIIAAAGSAILGPPPTFAAQGDAQRLPAALLGWVQDARARCESGGGAFTMSNDYWSGGDFNGDGTRDFVVTASAFRCSTSATFFDAGSSGNTYRVFVSNRAGSYDHGGAFLARAARVSRHLGRDVIVTPERNRGSSTIWSWNGREMAVDARP